MRKLAQPFLWIVLVLAVFPQVAQARVYDPSTGRWMQRDPAGYVDGNNLYQFVRSDPVGRQDWDGRLSINCVKIAGVPGSHCYLDFGDGDVGSGHNPYGWPRPGSIRIYFGPWEDSDDKYIYDNSVRKGKDPLGPRRETKINCPDGFDKDAAKQCAKETLDKIQQCQITYHPVPGPNSNTSLYVVYEKCYKEKGCSLSLAREKNGYQQPRTPGGAPPVGWPPGHNNDALDRVRKCVYDEASGCD